MSTGTSTVTTSPETDPPSETPEAGTEEQAEAINWFAEIRGLALMLFAVLMFHSLVAKPFYIPSASMLPNLLEGDRLVVSKYPYGWSWASASFHVLPRGEARIWPATPEYGDVVIPVHPTKSEDYIKRVVALPGDRIAVREGQIILNGTPVKQEMEPPLRIPIDENMHCDFANMETGTVNDYTATLADGTKVCEPPILRETMPNGASYLIIDHTDQQTDNMAERVIPEGHVFVMGDNRDHSADSRDDSSNGLAGPIPLENIGGRAEFITFSLDGTTGWNPLTWFSSLRSDRAWTTLRPVIADGDDNE